VSVVTLTLVRTIRFRLLCSSTYCQRKNFIVNWTPVFCTSNSFVLLLIKTIRSLLNNVLFELLHPLLWVLLQLFVFYMCFNYAQPEASNLSQRYSMISLSASRCICGLYIVGGAKVTCHGLRVFERCVSSDVCKILYMFKVYNTFLDIFWWATWDPTYETGNFCLFLFDWIPCQRNNMWPLKI